MEVSYLVGVIKKKKAANTSVHSRSLPGFLTSFSLVTHTRYKNACFATATALKICSRSYLLRAVGSKYRESGARSKNSNFFYFTKKNPSGIRTIFKFRSA